MSVNPKSMTIVIIFFISISGFFMGCSAPASPSQEKTPGNQNISMITISDIPPVMSFEDAVSNLNTLDFGQGTSNSSVDEKHILFFHGSKLDTNGDATSWIFFVGRGNQTYLATITPDSNSVTSWIGGVPDQEIVIDRIIHPSSLLTMNRDRIFATPANTSNSLDLTLSEGKYAVSIASDRGKHTLTFNAETGALISSNG